MKLFTIGYEGATQAEVIARLKTAGVQTLVDVRAVAASRRAGWAGKVDTPVITALNASFRAGWDLPTALRAAVTALGSTGDNPPRELLPTQLEVAVLDRSAVGRTFRRIPAALLATLLAPPAAAVAGDACAGML